MAVIPSPPVLPGDVVRVLPALADRAFARSLAGLDDWELLGMVRSRAGGSLTRAAACVGLMKAISRFDPAAGTNLAAYAQACISGEIKRHFRDKCWPVHVNRSVKDLVLKARKATSQLGVSGDDLRDAQRAEIASRPSSLDALLADKTGTDTLAHLLGEEDRGLE